MLHKILDYLRIGRAQTYPADLFLVLVPFLHGRLDLIQAAVLSVMVWFTHLLSFGQNSLLDSCIITEKGKPPPDFTDPSKQHHPLIKGTVSLHEAKNVVLWGLGVTATVFVAFTLLAAENLPFAIASLFLYYVWGSLYNEGLSKESPFGFLSISLCFTFLAMWAWFLSHNTINMLGLFYVAYVSCTILFQIAYSGFVKELEIKERSNLLVNMGARVDAENGLKRFVPGKSWIFAWFVKGLNLLFGALLLLENFSMVGLVMFALLSVVILHRLHQLTKPRPYIRNKELLSMSVMEILTIYLVPWLMLDPVTTIILEVIGVAYFFGINKLIWTTSYPAV